MIVFVTRARAVTDGLLDLSQLATPQPVVVVEIGIAPSPAAAGAVTGRAIIGEGHAPLGAGEIEQLWIVHDIGNRYVGKFVHHRPAQQLELI